MPSENKGLASPKPDMSPCGGCAAPTDHRLLDAVMLDADGNRCSEEAYCRACFPRFAKIAGDVWRPLGGES